MTKSSDNQRSGTAAKKSKNFVFCAVSPPKKEEDTDTTSNSGKRKVTKEAPNQTAAKKPKLVRSIDENSCDTIFGKLT